MLEANFTNESVKVFQYIKDILIKKYPSNKITVEYFLLSVLENHDSIAYQVLSKTTLVSTMETMHGFFENCVSNVSRTSNKGESKDGEIKYNTIFDSAIESAKKDFGVAELSSGHILISFFKVNTAISNQFSRFGITASQLLANLNSILPPDEAKKQNKMTMVIKPQKGAVEEFLVDMNNMASNGKIDEVIGNEGTINNIFNVLSKRDRNNVVVVGEPGIGKTATVSHIANLLVKGDVPKAFKNKKLMKVDFMTLVSGAALRGNFEAKFNAIIDDAVKKNGYIFFIDDLQSILSDKSKFAEINTENLLDMILMERNIAFICTMDEKSYTSCIQDNPSLKRRFQKVHMKEKDVNEVISILKQCKIKYEKYHNVYYTDSAIETCVNLVKRYVKKAKLPDYAIDIFDEVAAKKTMNIKEDERVVECKLKLKRIGEKIDKINIGTEKKDYDEYDNLKKEEIKLKSKLALIEKEIMLNSEPLEINEDDIREILSDKINVPLTKLTENETDKLKTLESRLKKIVIGQDAAIDEVCRVVKRQRVGLTNNTRPAVLFFSGMTGTGKTFLSKKIAQEVFGDEKSLVRLDMSEYSDKMSVNKLYGSAAGYIGYDKGGILTEAVKKNNHCVLLLDEMEKANEDVHNVFLQLFDEGRITDNMGNIVDFSNVIVIMTSNVGAKEISQKGKGIGFIRDENTNNKEAIEKAMKNKFSPEFINRIDSIIYFNRLSEENIKDIIKLELFNLNKRLENLKYKLGDTFTDDKCIQYIYNKVKEQSEYGARPVIHTIQHEIEDKITDYIIDKQPMEGFVFEIEHVGLEV